MVFSSPTFLFVFLPLTLVGTLLTPTRFRNAWLLAASVLFYLWGAGGQIGVLLYVSTVAFAGALVAYRAALRRAPLRVRRPALVGAAAGGGTAVLDGPDGLTDDETDGGADGGAPPDVRASRAAVVILIALLLVPILVYKYVPPVSAAVRSLGWDGAPQATWALPLGISFFTFHAISYVVDVTRRRMPPERSFRDFLLYLFLFPHQIAGPIVRYSEIVHELKADREVRLDQAMRGLTRFTWGLAKKACIADSVAPVANAVFATGGTDLNATTAWLGALAYTVQIYFDFSGYSDMAIGLAMMLGFQFPENFDAPYRSLGPADFWRRWHMTLSRWFRDYVYIPMGGNRYGIRREYAALLMTFLLTSLWHGATWPFLVWGSLHSLALVLERVTGLRDVKGWVWPRRVAMAAFVVAVWVPFRSESIGEAGRIWAAMVTGGFGDPSPSVIVSLNALSLGALAVGLVAFFGPRSRTGYQLVFGRLRFRYGVAAVATPVLLVVSVAVVLWNDFSPFLYFQF
jgi:alginate O-acetyltransferase complex protein AlgI